MLTPDRIIILNCTRFAERSLVLHCLSRQYGRCAFLVGNASKLMPFFQPLSILDCDTSDNPKSSLRNAKNFSDAHTLAGIRSSYGKNAISMFMAEVLFRAVREGSDEPGLFDWCESEIILLNELEGNYANFHIRFLLDFAAAMGFSPSFEALAPFLDGNMAIAREFLQCSAADAMLIRLNGDGRSELCERLLKYLSFHLELSLHIKSLDVLREIQ